VILSLISFDKLISDLEKCNITSEDIILNYKKNIKEIIEKKINSFEKPYKHEKTILGCNTEKHIEKLDKDI